MIKMTITKQLENFKAITKDFITKLRQRKSISAFAYRASEQPQKIVPNAPPQQFNVVEVRALITHVLTANALGFETMLRAIGEDELQVVFTQKEPLIPSSLMLL